MDAGRLAVLAAFLWCALALARQVRGARAGGRPHYGRPRGTPRRGRTYFFTAAMLPRHKESVRHHPLEFAVGTIMHLAVALSLGGMLLIAAHPAAGLAFLVRLAPLFWAGFAAGVFLLVRRGFSRDLRSMSTPDDYLAVLATLVLLAAAAAVEAGPRFPAAALFATAAVLFYVPLGKLRHAVFFFAARAEYGGRLGWRGVYPPPAPEAE